LKDVVYGKLYGHLYLITLFLSPTQEFISTSQWRDITVVSGVYKILKLLSSGDSVKRYIKVIYIDHVIYDSRLAYKSLMKWKSSGVDMDIQSYKLPSDRHYGFYMIPGDINSLFENHIDMRLKRSLDIIEPEYSILTNEYIKYFTRREAESHIADHFRMSQRSILRDMIDLLSLSGVNALSLTIYDNSGLLEPGLQKHVTVLHIKGGKNVKVQQKAHDLLQSWNLISGW
jgi:hypothetical protein